jgi:hypothetical protein
MRGKIYRGVGAVTAMTIGGLGQHSMSSEQPISLRVTSLQSPLC